LGGITILLGEALLLNHLRCSATLLLLPVKKVAGELLSPAVVEEDAQSSRSSPSHRGVVAAPAAGRNTTDDEHKK
jgi:hypothetical protein